MNGFSFVADTNFLIDVHEGKEKVLPFLDGTAIISVISEIELLGWYKLNPDEKKKLRLLLDDCIIFELTAEIRKLAIDIRQQNKNARCDNCRYSDASSSSHSQFG